MMPVLFVFWSRCVFLPLLVWKEIQDRAPTCVFWRHCFDAFGILAFTCLLCTVAVVLVVFAAAGKQMSARPPCVFFRHIVLPFLVWHR